MDDFNHRDYIMNIKYEQIIAGKVEYTSYTCLELLNSTINYNPYGVFYFVSLARIGYLIESQGRAILIEDIDGAFFVEHRITKET